MEVLASRERQVIKKISIKKNIIIHIWSFSMTYKKSINN